MCYNKRVKEEFMLVALDMAKKAFKKDEVPVGACVVKNGKVIAKAYNKREHGGTSVGHAEILSIIKASKKLKNFRLDECDLYVTLEPCPMCAGAIVNARIKNLFFGAYDPKSGYAGSLYNTFEDQRLNHKVNVEGGILKEECAQLLKEFFKIKRQQK